MRYTNLPSELACVVGEVFVPSDSEMNQCAQQVASVLYSRRLSLVTAESCTGGWITKTLTDVAGSSQWFERGFVTYSNEAKQEMLGVRPKTLQRHGAVSEPTVREMATGALVHSHAGLSVAVSGVAGPSGGSEEKPVGTVWLGWASRKRGMLSRCVQLSGDREAIRRQAVLLGLRGILDLVRLN